MNTILYNPKSNADKGHEAMSEIVKTFEAEKSSYKTVDITQIDVCAFLDEEPLDSSILIIGGDGTIHYLVNDLVNYNLLHKVYLYRGGTGNDFSRSIHQKKEVVLINDYLKNLPFVKINGEMESFINGCGLGLDGFVCDLVEKNRLKNSKSGFFRNTIKAFAKYKSRPATIYVDDEVYKFKKVYLASIMNGTHFGGGMKITPHAKRDDRILDICVVHRINRALLIFIFPLIYLGKHLWFKRSVFYKKGERIKIIFDSPTYGQIDGEVLRDIKEIEVYYK